MADEPSNPDDDEEGMAGRFGVSGGSPEVSPEEVDPLAARNAEGPIGPYLPPDAPHEVTLDESAIKDFLEKKGAVEILALLAEGPKRFGEIDQNVVASHGTLSSRLNTGARLNLWHEYFWYPEEENERKIKLYSLPPEAEEYAALARKHDIHESTKRYHKVAQQHSEAVESFRRNLPYDTHET